MPKFAANLTMLFNEVPFLDRFDAAAKAGFTAVEFLFPYGFDGGEIKARLRGNGQKLVLHNLPAGDWDAGERGIACHPDRIAEFQLGVAAGIKSAQLLGVDQLNCLAGKVPAGVSADQARETLLENLRYAAQQFKTAGLRLLIEPINRFDIPGFYLNTTWQALDLIEASGSDNIFVQYDIYHAQRTEGELANTLSKHLPQIGHVQLADNPGRNEPGTGEINYSFLFRHLDAIGYAGWIGCEYKPRADTLSGLGWLKTLNA